MNRPFPLPSKCAWDPRAILFTLLLQKRNLAVISPVHSLSSHSRGYNVCSKKGECMSVKQIAVKTLHGLRVGFIALTVFQFCLGGPLATSLQAQEKSHTRTPIKHVIVLIGEN